VTEPDGTSAAPLLSRPRRIPRPMPVIIMADTSGSMDGEKIAILNRSMATMVAAFAAEDSARGEIHVAVIAFGGDKAVLHQSMCPASRARWTDLTPRGRTPMGDAFDVVTAVLSDPDAVPERAFPPTLVLVSDGMPTDDWEASLDSLIESPAGGRSMRLAIGVGADRTAESDEVLSAFSTPGLEVMRTDQVHEIARLFRWVTATVTGALHARTGQQAVRLADLD